MTRERERRAICFSFYPFVHRHRLVLNRRIRPAIDLVHRTTPCMYCQDDIELFSMFVAPLLLAVTWDVSVDVGQFPEPITSPAVQGISASQSASFRMVCAIGGGYHAYRSLNFFATRGDLAYARILSPFILPPQRRPLLDRAPVRYLTRATMLWRCDCARRK